MAFVSVERMFDGAVAVERLGAMRHRLADRLIEDELGDRLGVTVDLSPAQALLERVASLDPTAVRDTDLLATVGQLSDLRRVIDGAANRLLSEITQRNTTDTELGQRPSSWLASTTGMSSTAARAQVRLAATLRDHAPDVAQAWAEGRIGEIHAKTFASALNNRRVRDAFKPMIGDLIDDAQNLHADMWRAKVTALVSLLDADGVEPRDPTEDNHLGFTRGLAGRWVLRGEFDAVSGAVIRDALSDRADRLFKTHSNDQNVAGTDITPPSQPHLMAQALHDMARCDRADNTGGRDGGRAEIVLHLDAADPTRLVDDDGVNIGDTGYRTTMCDPTLRGVVFGMKRNVLALGHEQRLVSRAQRRAMDERDGGCVFPGCDARATWTDAHHVAHWRDGGATDLANLASLCRHHHGVTHRKGWRMGVTDDEWFWWETPSRRRFWSQRHGIQRTGPPPAPPPHPSPHT